MMIKRFKEFPTSNKTPFLTSVGGLRRCPVTMMFVFIMLAKRMNSFLLRMMILNG